MSKKLVDLAQKNRTINCANYPSRLWFMSQGCKPVPPDEIGGKILWAHPDGYFLGAQGQKLEHTFCPASQRGFTAAHPSSGGFTGGCYPKMRHFLNRLCHLLMAIAFYGPRPTYTDENGKTYYGICHHLINDKLDYRPANLLCWLTHEEHTEADCRQRALKKITGDLHNWSYDKLREWQDPRITTRAEFDRFITGMQLAAGMEGGAVC